MTDHAAELVRKMGTLDEHREPWTHYTADDFLPADVFADLLACLPRLHLGPQNGPGRQRSPRLPKSASMLLNDLFVLDSIRSWFGFQGGKVLAEIAWFGKNGYPIHSDRQDKLWNGQVYLDGEAKGTELFDEQEQLVKVVEWKPNRFTCWLPPGGGKKHAAPASQGRFVLLWWILREKRQ